MTVHTALTVLGSSPRQCQQNEQRAGHFDNRGQHFNDALKWPRSAMNGTATSPVAHLDFSDAHGTRFIGKVEVAEMECPSAMGGDDVQHRLGRHPTLRA